jgi:predicted ferric reductase
MPALVAVLVYWFRVLRRPMDVRLKRRHVGGSAVLTLGAGMIVLWVQERPMTLPGRYKWGELAGVMAVYLFTWSLILATRARWLEPWFGGLDRMYLWHKRAAIAGTLLVLPHFTVTGAAPGRPANTAGLALGVISLLGIIGLVVISLPRAARILRLSYYRWKFLHRLMGLFVATSVIHGLVLDQVIASSLVLRVVFLIVGTAGFLCYLYEELLMRRLLPTADYTVTSVTRPAEDIVELRLTPSGPGITPQPGQFVFLHVGGDGAWHEHPFSVAGTGPGRQLRLSVRARGRETRTLSAELTPGLPAAVSGPYGMFDFTLGGRAQVWIAGGIGIVPFLSWLQALTSEDRHSVELFYIVPTEADAVYLPELLAQSDRLPSVRLHPVFTRTYGHLTGADVDAAIQAPITDVHTFICGPVPMVEDISRYLRRRGVPRDYIHAEHFAFR